MHMFSREKGFFGGHGIVGAQIAMGAGVAFAEKYNETGNVALLLILAMALPTKVRFMKPSIWQRFGNCRSSS